jgi:hypothetical protein
MIHLFGKVYLSYAECSVGPDAHEKKAERHVQIIDRGLSLIEHALFDPRRLHYSKTLQECLSHFGSDEAFFKLLATPGTATWDQKVVIYADEAAFIEVMIRWWKALFPALTESSAFALYQNFADSERLRSHSTLFLALDVDGSKLAFHKIASRYWGLDRGLFAETFQALAPFSLPREYLEDCSLEFLVMNFLLDDSTRHLPQLLAKVERLYLKRFMEELSAIKRGIEQDLYEMAERDPALTGAIALLPHEEKNRGLLEHPVFRILKDPGIKSSRSAYEHLSRNYELRSLVQALLDVDRAIQKQCGLDGSAVDLDNPCLAHFARHGSHPSPLDVLRLEAQGRSPFHFFRRFAQNRKMNPYLLPAFRSLLRQPGPDPAGAAREYLLC